MAMQETMGVMKRRSQLKKQMEQLLLMGVKRSMRCGSAGVYLLIFVKFVRAIGSHRVGWPLNHQLKFAAFEFFHIYELYKLHHNGNEIHEYSFSSLHIYLFILRYATNCICLSAHLSVALVFPYSHRNDVRGALKSECKAQPVSGCAALKIKLFHFE